MIEGDRDGEAMVRAIVVAATRREVVRLPFVVDGRVVGSVAVHHLPVLAGFADVLRVDGQQVELLTDPPERDAALARLHQALRALGHIRAWRDETYALRDPQSLRPLALIERAASRFWGALTFGAHATGYVADDAGRPCQLWIARRSSHKATDAGLLDNMVGGGVPFDQTPHQALLREAWEEAGLDRQLAGRAKPAGVLAVHRDIADGLQHEWLYSYDIALPAGAVPQNQDGEVAAFERMRPRQVQQCLADGAMTVDAALVTLHFMLRHHLLPESQISFDLHAACEVASGQPESAPPRGATI